MPRRLMSGVPASGRSAGPTSAIRSARAQRCASSAAPGDGRVRRGLLHVAPLRPHPHAVLEPVAGPTTTRAPSSSPSAISAAVMLAQAHAHRRLAQPLPSTRYTTGCAPGSAPPRPEPAACRASATMISTSTVMPGTSPSVGGSRRASPSDTERLSFTTTCGTTSVIAPVQARPGNALAVSGTRWSGCTRPRSTWSTLARTRRCSRSASHSRDRRRTISPFFACVL